MREQINQQQRANVYKAYKRCSIGTDYLDGIVNKGTSAKVTLVDLFRGQDTLTFERPLTPEELGNDWSLKDIADSFPEFSFAWNNQTVTERATGHCMPLKKFSEKNGLDYEALKHYCERTVSLVLSCNLWFLIGSSVMAHGYQLGGSCHYPDGSYASGAISYALDCHTVVACRWDGNGISGRQIIHIDTKAPGIVTGRLYGDFTQTDSTFIRKQIYSLFEGYKANEWKKTTAFNVNTRSFHGYTDSGYFAGYRPQKESNIEITLVSPVCPSCGDTHSENEITCCNGKYQCSVCGSRIYEEDSYSDDYDIYCEHCFFERYFYCDYCNGITSRDEMCLTDTGYNYCPHCAERKGYIKCDACGDYTRDYTVNESDGLVYCDSCLPSGSYCEHCRGFYEDDDIETAANGDKYCHSCADGHLDKCDDCGSYTNDAYTTGDGKTLCEVCTDKYTPCEHCGEIYADGRVTEHNPVCSEECATLNLFREVA